MLDTRQHKRIQKKNRTPSSLYINEYIKAIKQTHPKHMQCGHRHIDKLCKLIDQNQKLFLNVKMKHVFSDLEKKQKKYTYSDFLKYMLKTLKDYILKQMIRT